MDDINERVLFITDGMLNIPPARAGRAIDILGIGEDPCIWEQRVNKLFEGRRDVRLIDVRPWTAEVTASVRDYLNTIIQAMPGWPDNKDSIVGNILARQGKENLWWYLDISEKSPVSSLVQSLYRLGLMRKAATASVYSQVYWGVDNADLCATFCSAESQMSVSQIIRANRLESFRTSWLYWAHAVRFTLEVIAIKLIAFFARWPRELTDNAVQIFTIYPNWWTQPFEKHAADRFFPSLTDASETPLKNYLAWWSGDPRQAWQKRKEVKHLMMKEGLRFIQQHVSLAVLAQLYSPTIFLKLKRFKRAILSSSVPRYYRCDIRALIGRDLDRSVGSSGLALNQILEETVRKIIYRGRVRALLFRYEAQPIDRALCSAAKDQTLAIGYWHSALALSKNYMPFWSAPQKNAMKGQSDVAIRAPLPDAMLVTAAICEQTLCDQNYPRSSIQRCGPIRHKAALSIARYNMSRSQWRQKRHLPEDQTIVFLATSVVITDAIAMMRAAAHAMRNMEKLTLFVRIHPAKNLQPRIWKELEEFIDARNIQLVSSAESFYELLAASDIFVSGGSTIAFEAMALGVMPVIYENPNDFSATSFEPFEHACFIATDSESLSNAIREIRNESSEMKARKAAWPALLENVFGNIHENREQRFRAAIKLILEPN